MATAVQPLLVLSDERIEDEVRRATFIEMGELTHPTNARVADSISS